MGTRKAGKLKVKPVAPTNQKEKSSMDRSSQKVYVVFNPTAGKEVHLDDIRSAMAHHFPSPEWKTEIYETTGKEDIPALCRAACDQGAALVVSAGGDGTLVGVANGLVNRKVPLGILPMGTGNDLARALGVPLKLDDAVKLLAGDHAVIEVDALKVGDRHFFSNVSVGASPRMMKDTSSAEKKKFGRLAYIWSLIKRPSILQLHRYTLTIDGEPRSIRAAEVLISNSTLLEKPLSFFGPTETLNDGQLEVYLVTAENLGDYLHVLWDMFRRPGWSASNIHHLMGRQTIRIAADRNPQLSQGDGEVIGNTPVEIQMVPRAIQVIMPHPAQVSAASGVDAHQVPVKVG
jgi:diacylglycerol kinase (ATP)